MKPVETMVLLMCAVVAVVLLGRRVRMPYPIALVMGGLCISLVPGLPLVRIHPDLVFLLFLPPLLYAAGWMTSWHDFRQNLRPIFLLAVGLVLFTTVVVGIVLHALIPTMPLAVAVAFGAIVSPPDAVAATAIAQQVALPRRIITVLEGESLVNDATGLVALRFALAAAVSGTFSLERAALEFVWVVAGGLALGLVVGLAMAQVVKLINEDSLLITVTLLAPYIAYLPAERLHVSGVLAAVSAGIYGGWRAPELFSAGTRLNAVSVWDMLVFLVNCVLFILIGLQLPEVVQQLGRHSAGELLAYGALASALVIVIRPLWVFPATWLPRLLSRRLRRRDPIPPWRHVFIVAWSGMRGVVSLAAALALPVSLANGQPFPHRDLVIFLTFCVIFSTLVVQGLSLPFIVRRLRVKETRSEQHERDVREQLTQAALAHLNRLAEQKGTHPAALQQVIAIYQERLQHLHDDLAELLGWSTQREQLVARRRLRLEALGVERSELIRLRREHRVDDGLMREIEHEMDLEETRLRS